MPGQRYQVPSRAHVQLWAGLTFQNDCLLPSLHLLMLLSAVRAHMPRAVAGSAPKRGRQAVRAATAAASAPSSDAVRPKRRRAAAASAAHVKAAPDLHLAPGSSARAAEELAGREQAGTGAAQAADVEAKPGEKADAKPRRRRTKAEDGTADKADSGPAPEPILLASPQVLARKWVSVSGAEMHSEALCTQLCHAMTHCDCVQVGAHVSAAGGLLHFQLAGYVV